MSILKKIDEVSGLIISGIKMSTALVIGLIILFTALGYWGLTESGRYTGIESARLIFLSLICICIVAVSTWILLRKYVNDNL